jgi:hypothetical protein
VYQYTTKDIVRFWSKVAFTANANKCWEWKAGLRKDGYAQFRMGGAKGTMLKAHRVAYELTHNASPGDLYVCHSCDNRKCVNPNHLFLGTDEDNKQDMMNKGRQSKGEKQGRHKLSLDQVILIRQLSANEGISNAQLGRQFGVTKGAIRAVIVRDSWRNL